MGIIPPWSDLHEELLSTIAKCLNPIDILSFRSVCKSWYSSSSYSLSSPLCTLFPPLPLTTPSPPNSLLNRFSSILNPNATQESVVLSSTVIYDFRPLIDQLWMPRVSLLFLDQSVSGKVSFRKPFCRVPYSIPINFPRTLNLLDFRVSELGRFYNLSYLPNGSVKPSVFGIVHKVVLFSNNNGLAVVVLSDFGKLGLLRLGLSFENVGSETDWEIIHDGKAFQFDDIVEFRSRVLGNDRRGSVYEIKIVCANCLAMDAKHAIVSPIADGGGNRKRLVESLGRLYLVDRSNLSGKNDALFKVYELNNKKWVEVSSLGDQTFFFSPEFSFSVATEKLHDSYGKNCILFSEQSFLNYEGYDGDYVLFMTSVSNNHHIRIWHLEDASHLGLIESHPGYSNLFWPPPSWFWPKDRSERLDTLSIAQSRIPDENLKAKFHELSPLQQNCALQLEECSLKMKELLNRFRAVVIKMKAIEIEMLAVPLEKHSNSENLHNQIGSSRQLTAMERHASFDPILKAVKQNDCDFDWFFMVTGLDAHLLQFEENFSELENALEKENVFAIVE